MEIKVQLFLDRETKNTIRYTEATNPPKLSALLPAEGWYQGVVYIQKSAFGREANYPREIEITIASPKAKLGVVS